MDGRFGPRPVEVREAISRTMTGVPRPTAVRRKISRAMTGVPKVCSLCGETGHNRRRHQAKRRDR